MESNQETNKEINGYDDLLNILEIILNHIGIIKSEKNGNFSQAIEKLKTLKTNTEDNDLDLFSYFLKQLFLDEKNKEFDFDVNLLRELLEDKIIVKIFMELKKGIETQDFYSFLSIIGTIFISFYFIDDKVQNFFEDKLTRCNNSYECIILILFYCKKKNDVDWFLGIYRGHFQIQYQTDILFKLIISIKNHYILLYGEDILESFDNIDEEKEKEEQNGEKKDKTKDGKSIENYNENEEIKSKTKEYEYNKIEKEKIGNIGILKEGSETELNKKEDNEKEFKENEGNEKNVDISDIRLNFLEFFCHSTLFYDKYIQNFVNIFFNFITEGNSLDSYFSLETYSKQKTLNICESKYLKYIINLFEKVFSDLKKKTIDNFFESLYKFICDLNIKYYNTFIETVFEIGKLYELIPNDICIVSMIYFSEDYIKKIETEYKEDENFINGNKKDLNVQEKIILDYIINQRKVRKKENENIIEKKNEIAQENILKCENNNNRIQEEKILSNAGNNSDEEESKIKHYKLKNGKDDIDNNLKNIKINGNSLEEKRSNSSLLYKNEIEKNENYYKKELEDLKAIILEHEKKINALSNIHKNIYFRDVSKYYILEFAKKYIKKNNNITKYDAYQSSQKILKFDFKRNRIKHLENIMNKIISHYLQGNKFAHLEYFVCVEGKKRPKELFNKIKASYSLFMNFDKNEVEKLSNEFNDNKTMNLLLKKYFI